MTILREIAESTHTASSVLERLGRGESLGVGPLDAMAEGARADFVAWEHDPGTRPHLVEHGVRAMRCLAFLEGDGVEAFRGLSEIETEALRHTVTLVERVGVAPVVRLALVLLDFAKGGTEARRDGWTAGGADLTVHNEAAAQILKSERALAGVGLPDILDELLLQIVRNHGLAGQHARGETPIAAFRPWVTWLSTHANALSEQLKVTPTQAVTVACNAMHLVDAIDTEAVRAGLVDDRLLGDLRAMRDLAMRASGRPDRLDETEPLEERFARLRRQAHESGEPATRLDAALRSVSSQRTWIDEVLPHAQLWYFEPATHALSSEAALRLLLLGLGQAEHNDTVDCSKPFHLSFQPLVDALGAPTTAASYRVRLVEALLLSWDLDSLARGEFPTDVLAGFTPRIGGTTAVALELHTSEEADALVTLLALYEKRSSVAFHQILKLLCDTYGLRKDDFDRLSNEAQYLATMNAARSDKERMLDFARPGTIVEIGPGGGVVLDLLEARFPESDIVGIDVSEAVVEELERRRQLEGRSWRIVAGDAFELPALVARADTVIFCSLLHEIYSYVERDGRKFTFAAVRELLQAAYAALEPGGRIIIRDGVKPPPGRRVIEFTDPEGPDYLRRFQADFEGRTIEIDWLSATRAAMSTADAMEFLYCYTWGPSSYPYEVRELYGIMERDEYEAAVLDWLPGAITVDVPLDLKSYLQPGYVTGLAPKIGLCDESGAAVDLPDSNAIWVFERS